MTWQSTCGSSGKWRIDASSYFRLGAAVVDLIRLDPFTSSGHFFELPLSACVGRAVAMATRPLDGIFPGPGHLKRRGVAIFCGTRRSIQMCTKSFLSIFIFFYFICGNWRPLGGHIKVQTRQKICDTKAFVCWVQQICGAVGARDKSTKSRGGGGGASTPQISIYKPTLYVQIVSGHVRGSFHLPPSNWRRNSDYRRHRCTCNEERWRATRLIIILRGSRIVLVSIAMMPMDSP